MSKIFCIVVLFITNMSFSQTADFGINKVGIDTMLVELGKIEISKKISSNFYSKEIRDLGINILPILSDFFSDTSETNIYSRCLNRKLNKGETALILADLIEIIPNQILPGLESDINDSCFNNSINLELYLNSIKRDGILKFQEKYKEWLNSNERENWMNIYYSSKKVMRKEKQRKKRLKQIELQFEKMKNEGYFH